PGAGVDPLVGRIDVLADLVVGDHPFGPVRPDAEQSDLAGTADRRNLAHGASSYALRITFAADGAFLSPVWHRCSPTPRGGHRRARRPPAVADRVWFGAARSTDLRRCAP